MIISGPQQPSPPSTSTPSSSLPTASPSGIVPSSRNSVSSNPSASISPEAQRARQRELLALLEQKSQRCHELQALLDSAEAKLRERDADIRKMQLASYQAKYRMQQLASQLEAKDKELQKLQALSNHDAALAELARMRKLAQEQAAKLKKQALEIQNKDNQIRRLNKEIEATKSLLITGQEAGEELNEKENAEPTRRKEMSDLVAALSEKHIADQEARIGELQSQLATLELQSAEMARKSAETEKELMANIVKLREAALTSEKIVRELQDENKKLKLGEIAQWNVNATSTSTSATATATSSSSSSSAVQQQHHPSMPTTTTTTNPTNPLNKAPAAAMTGVGMMIRPNGRGDHVIAGLTKGGPAFNSKKLAVDDQLVAIDGRRIDKGASTDSIKAMILGEPSSVIAITVLRRTRNVYGQLSAQGNLVNIRLQRSAAAAAAAPPPPPTTTTAPSTTATTSAAKVVNVVAASTVSTNTLPQHQSSSSSSLTTHHSNGVPNVEDKITIIKSRPQEMILTELEAELRRTASALQRSIEREEASVNLQRLVSDKLSELARARQDAEQAMRRAAELAASRHMEPSGLLIEGSPLKKPLIVAGHQQPLPVLSPGFENRCEIITNQGTAKHTG